MLTEPVVRNPEMLDQGTQMESSVEEAYRPGGVSLGEEKGGSMEVVECKVGIGGLVESGKEKLPGEGERQETCY